MKKHEERKHSTVGASNSKTWLNCPGSVNLSAKAPPKPPNIYADKGTQAHEYIEKVLRKKLKFEKVPDEFKEGVKDFINYFDSVKGGVDEIFIEEKVDLSFIDPLCFGSVDLGLYTYGETLRVVDYKNGVDPVEVEENTQLIYYALGLAEKLDWLFEEVVLAIVQPNAYHEHGTQREWTITREKLKSYIPLFRKGVQRTKNPDAKLFADPTGKWCKWCQANVICPEFNKRALTEIKTIFKPQNEIQLPDPKDLSPEKIGGLLNVLEVFDKYYKSVEAYALDLLKRGGKIEGYKLVPTRPSRQWRDEDKAEAVLLRHLKNEAFDTKLISPAQAAKKLNKDLWTKLEMTLVDKISSGVTIAPDSDKRQATTEAKSVFAPIKKAGANGLQKVK